MWRIKITQVPVCAAFLGRRAVSGGRKEGHSLQYRGTGIWRHHPITCSVRIHFGRVSFLHEDVSLSGILFLFASYLLHPFMDKKAWYPDTHIFCIPSCWFLFCCGRKETRFQRRKRKVFSTSTYNLSLSVHLLKWPYKDIPVSNTIYFTGFYSLTNYNNIKRDAHFFTRIVDKLINLYSITSSLA